MKKSLIFAAALVLAAACTPSKDTYQLAIENAIAEKYGEGAKVRIEICERVDSTTFGEELAYRQKVFDLRLAQNQKLLIKYREQGKPNAAQMKREAILHDNEVIDGLARMHDELGAKLDEIAYYDYCFSGRVSLNGSSKELKDYYATVTPEGEVMNFDAHQKYLHKPMGHIIPGYVELVKGEDAEESVEQ